MVAVMAASDNHPARWVQRERSGLYVPRDRDEGFAAERLAMVQERSAGREITSRELREVQPPDARRVRPISGGGSAPTYMVVNGAMPTTAALASITTAAVIKTMLQLKPAQKIRIIEWGASYDGTTAATPGKVELLTTGAITATVTAYAAADVFLWGDSNAAANTAGTSGVPLNLGTAQSGFTATVEGSIVATNYFDLQLLPPTGPYVKQFPLNREPDIASGGFLRVRNTFPVAINAYYYVIFEV